MLVFAWDLPWSCWLQSETSTNLPVELQPSHGMIPGILGQWRSSVLQVDDLVQVFGAPHIWDVFFFFFCTLAVYVHVVHSRRQVQQLWNPPCVHQWTSTWIPPEFPTQAVASAAAPFLVMQNRRSMAPSGHGLNDHFCLAVNLKPSLSAPKNLCGNLVSIASKHAVIWRSKCSDCSGTSSPSMLDVTSWKKPTSSLSQWNSTCLNGGKPSSGSIQLEKTQKMDCHELFMKKIYLHV